MIKDKGEIIATMDKNGYTVYVAQILRLIKDNKDYEGIKEALDLEDANTVQAIQVCIAQGVVEQMDDGGLLLTEEARRLLSFEGADLTPPEPTIDLATDTSTVLDAIQKEFANELAFDVSFDAPLNVRLIAWEPREKLTADGRQRLAQLTLLVEDANKEVKVWLNLSQLNEAQKLQKMMQCVANDVRAQKKAGVSHIVNNRFRVRLKRTAMDYIHLSEVMDYVAPVEGDTL